MDMKCKLLKIGPKYMGHWTVSIKNIGLKHKAH